MRSFPRFCIWILPAALSCLFAPSAWAKSKKNLTYDYDTVWKTTIRFLRADQSYPIKDRDRDAGYVLFIYPGTGSVKECSAALEVLNTKNQQGRPIVRLQLEIAHQPAYIELSLLDRLERKLLEEQGEPPPSTRRPKPKGKPRVKEEQPSK